MERAKVLITMKHGMARLDNVWGVGGGQRPVMFLIGKVSSHVAVGSCGYGSGLGLSCLSVNEGCDYWEKL